MRPRLCLEELYLYEHMIRDGKHLINSCKVCKNNIQKDWRHRPDNKERLRKYQEAAWSNGYDYILDYFVEHPCEVCGETDPIVLEFDHIDPSNKTKEISVMINNMASEQRLADEISKCRVLCANCHKRKTARDRNSIKYRKIKEREEYLNADRDPR